jgi:hypothetical protein
MGPATRIDEILIGGALGDCEARKSNFVSMEARIG